MAAIVPLLLHVRVGIEGMPERTGERTRESAGTHTGYGSAHQELENVHNTHRVLVTMGDAQLSLPADLHASLKPTTA